MHSSIREIRQRLLLILWSAFATVLFLSAISFLAIASFYLSSSNPPVPFPFANLFEGYYLANNSWDGVERVFDANRNFDGLNPLLLDDQKRIILDRRSASVSTVGELYEPQPKDLLIDLRVNDEIVGYLVLTTFDLSARIGFAAATIIPLGIITLLLLLFMFVAANLLIRRFVNPLAGVIYAANSVADGRLDTRISTEGPQDLRSLGESFNAMASSLERSDRERRDMLADVAHELRTPLSVIRGRLEGIIDGIYPENGPQVSTALEQTYLLERLVDDLRLLTLAETRQLVFDKTDVNVGKLIDTVIEMLSAQAKEKNISLFFTERSGNLTAHVDPQRLEQVLSNLISNALRYVHEGGKVWVTALEIENGMQVTVNDNGMGVPDADLPYIFDRFWRKDKSRSRASGGTGLGLAISRQLIEAQGGKIEAHNLPEGGLQVVLTLKR